MFGKEKCPPADSQSSTGGHLHSERLVTGVANGLSGRVQGNVDMTQGIALQAAHAWIVFFMRQILMRLLQRRHSIVQAAAAVRMHIGAFGAEHVLAHVQAQLHYITLSQIDFAQGSLLAAPHLPVIAGTMIDQPSGLIQICLGMRIERMATGFVGMRRNSGKRRCSDG